MLIRSVKADLTKVFTTKSVYWCSLIVLAIVALYLVSMRNEHPQVFVTDSDGNMVAQRIPVVEDRAFYRSLLGGFITTIDSVMIIMILLTVTTEYSFSTVRQSLVVQPRRWVFVTSKLIVNWLICFVLSVVSYVIAVFGSKILRTDAEVRNAIHPFSTPAMQVYGESVLYLTLIVFLGVGLGVLIRHTAGAISLALLWPLLIEGILIMLLPEKVRNTLSGFMPYTNWNAFLNESRLEGAHWGPTGSLIYFTCFVAVIFGISVLLFKRRDA